MLGGAASAVLQVIDMAVYTMKQTVEHRWALIQIDDETEDGRAWVRIGGALHALSGLPIASDDEFRSFLEQHEELVPERLAREADEMAAENKRLNIECGQLQDSLAARDADIERLTKERNEAFARLHRIGATRGDLVTRCETAAEMYDDSIAERATLREQLDTVSAELARRDAAAAQAEAELSEAVRGIKDRLLRAIASATPRAAAAVLIADSHQAMCDLAGRATVLAERPEEQLAAYERALCDAAYTTQAHYDAMKAVCKAAEEIVNEGCGSTAVTFVGAVRALAMVRGGEERA